MMFKFGIDYDNRPECFDNKKCLIFKATPIRDIILKHQKITGKRPLKVEVRHVWDHKFNLKEKLFEIPVERIKIIPRGDHEVLLSDFAVEPFQE